MLEFLCVDLYNQCNNVINQCNFIFSLWSIMRLDTYYCLIFFGFILIHLTDPLNQVVQIMSDIYKCKWKDSLLIGWKSTRYTHSWKHTLGLNLEEEGEKLIEPGFSHHHWTELLLEHQWSEKWLFMALIKVSISFIAI